MAEIGIALSVDTEDAQAAISACLAGLAAAGHRAIAWEIHDDPDAIFGEPEEPLEAEILGEYPSGREIPRQRSRVLVSGEWLLDGDAYATVFEAEITGQSMAGVEGRVTRRVMEGLVAEEARLRKLNPAMDELVWDGDAVRWTCPEIDPTFHMVLRADEDGMFTLPYWTWQIVDPAEDHYQAVIR